MNDDEAYQEIQFYDRAALAKMWSIIKNQPGGPSHPNPYRQENGDVIEGKPTPQWNSGQAFEFFILRCFELDGAEVRYPYGEIAGLDGITQQTDGVIYSSRVPCLVESKDWVGNIGMKVFAKLKRRLIDRNSQMIGCIFSSRSSFKQNVFPLSFYAQESNLILLWNTNEIDYLISNGKSFLHAIDLKYRKALEQLVPYYDVTDKL